MSKIETIYAQPRGTKRETPFGLEKPLNIELFSLSTEGYQLEKGYPLAIFTLAGGIENSQPNLHAIKLSRANDAEAIITVSQQLKAEVVALSSHQGTLPLLENTLDHFRSLEKKPTIILGGAIPTHLGTNISKKYSDLPLFIVTGWGESTLASMIHEMSLGKFDQNSPQIKTGVIAKRPDSDYFQYPWQHGVMPFQKYFNQYFVGSSRISTSYDCNHGACIFCLRDQNETWKPFDPDDVSSQMEKIVNLGFSTVTLADEDPIGNSPERFQALITRFQEIKNSHPSFQWTMNVRTPQLVSHHDNQEMKKIFEAAVKSGLKSVINGAEAFEPKQLKFYKSTNITPEDNFKLVEMVLDAGLEMGLGIIPFHPFGDLNELGGHLNFIKPRLQTFLKTIMQPIGTLRVQHDTPYLSLVKAKHPELIGNFDQNMLTYECRYKDVHYGALAAVLKTASDLTKMDWKESLDKYLATGDIDARNRVRTITALDFNLLLKGYEIFTQTPETEKAIQLLMHETYDNYLLEASWHDKSDYGMNDDAQIDFMVATNENLKKFTEIKLIS